MVVATYTYPDNGVQFRHGNLLCPLHSGRHLLLVLSSKQPSVKIIKVTA